MLVGVRLHEPYKQLPQCYVTHWLELLRESLQVAGICPLVSKEAVCEGQDSTTFIFGKVEDCYRRDG